MKKFLVLAVVSLLILSAFVACGGGDMKDDMTTMMDDMTSMMDAMTSDGRGEVTEDETTEEITEEDLTGEELTTDETTDKLEEDITEAESKAKNILDDITE
ncbi:MAG: hypothetical protein IKK60_03175 [Clostridia bacterium]|nr:hypothetical protein [Clostridia bacterium]